MSFAGRPLEQLTDVFREYLLQHLPASSLARLPSGVVWRTAARSVLPSEAVPQAAPGKAVQTCLRQQGLTLAAISSGSFASCEIQQQVLNLWGPCIFDWAPCSPADGISHYLLAGTCLLRCSTAPSAWGPSLPIPHPEIPGPCSPTVGWHCWCLNDAEHLHLAFTCRSPGSGDWMCILDVASWRLVANRRLALYRDSVLPAIRGSTLLFRDSTSCLQALNIPSLEQKFQLNYQQDTLQPECQTVEWAGWSYSGQILIIWTTCDKLLVAIHEPCHGSLQAMYRIENGQFEHFNRDNVSPAPLHPFLALAYREVGTDEEEEEEEVLPRPGHHAAVLDLRSGLLHPVVYGGDSESCQCWARWEWAPSGLAAAFEETTQTSCSDKSLHIWHAPSKSIVYAARGQCNTEVRWSPDGKVCVLVKNADIVHVLHLHPTSQTPSPAELYLEERSRPEYPDQTYPAGTRAVVSISPCATRLIACGLNIPAPSRIEHWKLSLNEGCYDWEPVACPATALKGRRPVMAWWPGVRSACLYAVIVGQSTVQIMSGRGNRPLAAWPVFTEGHDGSGPPEPVYTLSWSPDGQKLACRGPERLAIFRF
ncbi:hypothetical protein WJX74_008763 [Apatococcus lobatus]|uniref:Uncharacterized protein n=1 Tax=Apatococcus lobatus TaxID=904363 RepID=A0AAW1RFI1_9CHLO